MTGNIAVPPQAGSSPGERVLSLALTVGTIAAFAIPGVGIFIAAGLAGINYIVGSAKQNTPPITAQELQTTIVAALDAHDLNVISTEVTSYLKEYLAYFDKHNHITVPIPVDLDAAIRDHATDPGVMFYNLLKDWMWDHTLLLDKVNTLTVASTNTGPNSSQVLGLAEFLVGAGLFLAVYKTYAIVAKAGGATFEEPMCTTVLDQLSTWIAYVNDQVSSITEQIGERTAQVTPVTAYKLGTDDFIVMDEYGVTPDQWSLVYFADSGPPVPNFALRAAWESQDTSLGWAPDSSNRVASAWGTDETALTSYRSSYVEQLTAALYAEFGNFDPDKTRKILGLWDATKQTLEYMLSHNGELPPQAS